MGRPHTKVERFDAPPFHQQDFCQTLSSACIIFANVPKGAPETVLLSLFRHLSKLSYEKKKVLLLFRTGSNHKALAHNMLPYLQSKLLQEGPMQNPSYRRQALYCNIEPEAMVVTNANKGVIAGDGIPKVWAKQCALWLSHRAALPTGASTNDLRFHVRGQPSHKRTRARSEFGSVEVVPTSTHKTLGDKVLHHGRVAKVLSITGETTQEPNKIIEGNDEMSVTHLVRRFTQRMDLRERSGVTCVNLHFRSVGVTCVNLCLTTRPTGVKRAKNGCVKNYASERVERQRSNAGKYRVRRLASKDLRGVLRQRKRPH